MTTAQRYVEAIDLANEIKAQEFVRDVRAFVDTEPMTPERARVEWFEGFADTEAEEDLAYSIFGPVFWMVVAIFLALLAFGLLVKFGVLIDPGVMK